MEFNLMGLQACQRCGGEKEGGVQGAKLCDACRKLSEDAVGQMETERGRRRWVAEMEARKANGEELRHRRDAPEGTKWCARGQHFPSLKMFTTDRSGKTSAYCKPCTKSYNRERMVKMKYGLDWDEYELLLVCQDHRCAICGGMPRKHVLAVDHDHQTGEIRGLLCSRCNHKLLGSANDDPNRLRKAADYLESFDPREVFGERKIVPGFEDT